MSKKSKPRKVQKPRKKNRGPATGPKKEIEVLKVPSATDPKAWAADIAKAWASAREGVIAVGRRLIDARTALAPGGFKDMVEIELPFTRQTAYKLIAIAENERFSAIGDDSQGEDVSPRGDTLPNEWTTLYELHRLPDDVYEHAVQEGQIKPDMTRADVARIAMEAEAESLKAENDKAKAADAKNGGELVTGDVGDGLLDLAAAGRTFAVIVADPPWKFKTWSDKDGDRAPDYPTMPDKEIEALPVGDVAMKDSVLLLWAVMPKLPAALKVIEAWGFEFKTVGFTWVKQKTTGCGMHIGGGKWTRANAELCLLATRGSPKRYATDIQELIVSPLGRHSEKPGEALARAERLLKGPYLELFARKRRPGWTALGNQLAAGGDCPPTNESTGTEGPEIPAMFKRDGDNKARFMRGAG